jgi:hypothetical protein
VLIIFFAAPSKLVDYFSDLVGEIIVIVGSGVAVIA